MNTAEIFLDRLWPTSYHGMPKSIQHHVSLFVQIDREERATLS
jgi:hypothetical protein